MRGRRLIRVTEVLGYFEPPELVKWRMREGNRAVNKVLNDTEKVGTRIDALIKEGLEPTSKDNIEVKNCYTAYCKWKKIYEPREIFKQERLYGKIEGIEVTGEPDLMIDSVLTDLKATNAIRFKNWVQLNVYEELRRQNNLLPSPMLRLLRLDRHTGSYEYPDAKPFDERLVRMFGGLAMAYVYYKGEINGVEL